jgi:hypothetical protein
MAARGDLTYNIVETLLTGEVDGVHISARAHSGGRGGSKKSGVHQYFLADNPFATGVKLDEKKKGSVGGTLPMGSYTLRLHESRDNWIRLIPAADNNMKGRSGFAIHGRGKRGSDGCIVPTDFHLVLKLCKLVEARKKKGLSEITLQVVAIGADVDKKLREWQTIA